MGEWGYGQPHPEPEAKGEGGVFNLPLHPLFHWQLESAWPGQSSPSQAFPTPSTAPAPLYWQGLGRRHGRSLTAWPCHLPASPPAGAGAVGLSQAGLQALLRSYVEEPAQAGPWGPGTSQQAAAQAGVTGGVRPDCFQLPTPRPGCDVIQQQPSGKGLVGSAQARPWGQGRSQLTATL